MSFHGKPEVVIPVGEELYSDEVSLDLDPADPLLQGRNLAVSLFVKRKPIRTLQCCARSAILSPRG